jgi:hypothetical protein
MRFTRNFPGIKIPPPLKKGVQGNFKGGLDSKMASIFGIE